MIDPMSPVIQYGFAGLSVVLLSILVWMVKSFLAEIKESRTAYIAVAKETTEAFSNHTEALHDIKAEVNRSAGLLTDVRDRLLERPCIIGAKDCK